MRRQYAMLRQAILAVGTMIFLWPGIAYAAATTVGNVYFDFNSKTCNNFSACSLAFAKVPTGKTLVIHRVSCRTQVSSTAKVDYLVLRRQSTPSVAGSQWLAPFHATSTLNGLTHYIVNADAMLALSGPNDWPTLQLTLRAAAPIFSLNCNIHGLIN